jgi:hypothetical protein
MINVVGAMPENPKEVILAGHDLLRRHCQNAGCSQLYRERQAVKATTEFGDRRRVVTVETEVRAVALRSLDEQLNRVRLGNRLRSVVAGGPERGHGEQDLADDAEGLPAGREDSNIRRQLEDSFTDRRDRGAHVLAVVKEEEPGASLQITSHLIRQVPLGTRSNTECCQEHLGDVVCTGHGRELGTPRLARLALHRRRHNVGCKTRLAGAAGADQGHEAVLGQQGSGLGRLVFAIDEWRR